MARGLPGFNTGRIRAKFAASPYGERPPALLSQPAADVDAVDVSLPRDHLLPGLAARDVATGLEPQQVVGHGLELTQRPLGVRRAAEGALTRRDLPQQR